MTTEATKPIANHAIARAPLGCPLCGSPFTSHEIETNHRLDVACGEVRGVIAGIPTLRAVCAKGCEIRVQASVTTEFLFAKEASRFDEEKPPTPALSAKAKCPGCSVVGCECSRVPCTRPGCCLDSPPATPRTSGYERDPVEPEQ